ncbi:MAG TPA: GNAT family N-acetyltransferase [Pseudonocardiaceae bacterium]
MSDVEVREAVAADREFVLDMVVAAANWARTDRTRAETLADPDSAHYVDGWPRPTDVSVIATDGGIPIGAAFLRFFTESDPGFGFVRADVPELAIGVVDGRRGQGVGKLLMRGVADAARRAGLAQISLSVERTNTRATTLYRAQGYQVVEAGQHSDTMLLDL